MLCLTQKIIFFSCNSKYDSYYYVVYETRLFCSTMPVGILK